MPPKRLKIISAAAMAKRIARKNKKRGGLNKTEKKETKKTIKNIEQKKKKQQRT